MPETPRALKDRFGRTIEYLRLSVTDRCDLRCSYCMPQGFKDFEEPDHWLTFDEIGRLVAGFAKLGVRKVRLTGGEPLLRRNLPDLAKHLGQIDGIEDLSLSTNGTRLAKFAPALRDAGVSRLNVSLDSLNPERIRRITGRDVLADIVAGLMAAKDYGFDPIKINMVVLGGTNDDEIDDMVSFCIRHGFILRLIEAMPMGETGRHASYISVQPIRERLQREFGLVDGIIPGGGPAHYLKSPDGKFSVGFIAPISQHFCATCNRVRLSVAGTLYMCLGQHEKMEFRDMLRQGASDAELMGAIKTAIELKPERHEFREAPQKMVRIMAKTGG